MYDSVRATPITIEEVAHRELEEQFPREIIDGVWAEDNKMAYEAHTDIVTELTTILHSFVKRHNLGKVYGDGMTYVLDGEPGAIKLMRVPDVSFVAKEHVLPKGSQTYYFIAPDLAVEVISETERKNAGETLRKVSDYLQYGTQQVWVIDPEKRTVTAFLPDNTVMIYQAGQTLGGGDLLPGFKLVVSEIFA